MTGVILMIIDNHTILSISDGTESGLIVIVDEDDSDE